MALVSPHQLPVPSTLSRFLASVDQPCLEALRQLFLQGRLQQPADLSVTHLESQVQRERFEVNVIADWLPERSLRVGGRRRPG